MSGLFTKHTYGTQTTIGTIDHLKNPSMKEIMKYYNKYYVPNNMAIIMSGDFDPDKTIQQIEKKFGKFSSKPVEPYKFEKEAPITSKIIKEVKGPDAETVALSWRFNGAGSSDADMLLLVRALLNNGKAGLIDLNLNQAQKVLNADSYADIMKDYSTHSFFGIPKSGQSLEAVEKLILEQIALLREGKFPDWLMQAVITDMKLQKTKQLENNISRAMIMMGAFTNDISWQHETSTIERLSKITKQQVVDFVKANYKDNNYVVVYKRRGEDKLVEKVEKPAITPVDVDRENKSPFVKQVLSASTTVLEPQFIDYKKDITKTEIKSGIPVLYNKNNENLTFELFYAFDMGTNNDKLLKTAIDYIPYLGTSTITPAKVQEELYKLGCSLDVFTDVDETWVNLSGLSENFEKALQLFESLLSDPKVEKESLNNLVDDILKEREDAKLNKGVILNTAMVSYALYGPVNPFTYAMTSEELKKIGTDDVSKKLKSLNGFKHRILFYGPQNLEEVKTTLNKFHNVPSMLKDVPQEYDFKRLPLGNKVLVADYDMKQVEIVMLSDGCMYDANLMPVISLYNNYFGGTMSGVVFQDLRESKALAYSAFSRFQSPGKPTKHYFNYSYVGSQADKLGEALTGMKNLLEDVPKADASFFAAREMLIQSIRSERITKSDVLFNYMMSQKYNHDHDIRKDIFEKCQQMGFEDVKKFQETHIKGKPVTTLVLGKKEALDNKILEKYGSVQTLTLKELFGY
jgi:predicted Zn-dependent peptidase